MNKQAAETLKKKAYQDLRKKIITNQLRAGQQLYENKLLQSYGIGRSALREILQELQRDGLIESLPKLGARVVTLDLQTLKDLVQLRRNLEGFAAELAAINIKTPEVKKLRRIVDGAKKIHLDAPDAFETLSDFDTRFHEIIYAAAGNRLLTESIRVHLLRMSMYWFQTGFSVEEFLEQFEDLENLVDAMESRDAPAAKACMERHMDHFARIIKNNYFNL